MTLAPSRELGPRLSVPPDDFGVTYELEDVCYVAGCPNRPEPGSHHIQPRSQTAGPKPFVSIDGVLVANTVRLCTVHHRDVTGGVGGHRAKIVWNDRVRGWIWLTRRGDGPWEFVAPLKKVTW